MRKPVFISIVLCFWSSPMFVFQSPALGQPPPYPQTESISTCGIYEEAIEIFQKK